MKPTQRFVRDESGMAMALAVIMIALFSVMGAGLLVFATSDLGIVVDANRGQRAFEMADTGIQAAKRQLDEDSKTESYNGGSNEVQWSASKPNTDPNCSGLGGYGVCISNLDGDSTTDDRVAVEIESMGGGRFKVVSTGEYGPAMRKIEATFRMGGGVSIPRAYFARGNLSIGGSANPDGISFFSLGTAEIDVALGGATDKYFGRWAEHSGSESYPNPYNLTPRSSSAPGVAARLGVTGDNVPGSGRTFDPGTTPSLVENYGSDYNESRIAFPFKVPDETEDRQEIELLKEQALALERETGDPHYIDSNPGNGVDDAGLPNGNRSIDSWPSDSKYDTVVFYKYESYDDKNNVVSFSTGSNNPKPPCDEDQKGVIVVENGDAKWTGNKPFNGGVVIRAYNDASKTSFHPTGGKFIGAGTPCLAGYVNTSGNMNMTGNIGFGTVPPLSDLRPFNGSPEMIGWRELYD